MKGKAKEKRKIGKVILIGMGFFLTIILTFTTTLAWFYDSDWASKYINMAGTVGIEMRSENPLDPDNQTNLKTSGSGNLYFKIGTDKAYPGQAVEASASVYNNGGRSGENAGSECYIRAHFAVYTNIGKLPDAADYVGGTSSEAYKAAVAQYKITNNLGSDVTPSTNDLEAAGIKASDYDGGEDSTAYKTDLATAQNEKDMNATELYKFLHSLIVKQNAKIAEDSTLNTDQKYYWKYYQHEGALPLSTSGTGTDTNGNSDIKYYMDGTNVKDTSHDKDNSAATTVDDVTKVKDKGYFYLCKSADGVLRELALKETAVFLWNNTFIIPWQLTNNSADKLIYVGLTFQAIQTYIPVIQEGANAGIISGAANNRLDPSLCTYNSTAVQTVFSSCNFTPLNTTIKVNGEDINFADGNYVGAAAPENPASTPGT